jgi:hypothetical protein
MPTSETASSLLFVIDLVNSKPGEKGEFSIRDIRFVR